MQELRIIYTQSYNLTKAEQADLLEGYTDDDKEVLRDILEWQFSRYGNDIDVNSLCRLAPESFIVIVIYMLHEKRIYGYPWQPWKDKRLPEHIIKNVPVWIIPPKKACRGKRGNDGWENARIY